MTHFESAWTRLPVLQMPIFCNSQVPPTCSRKIQCFKEWCIPNQMTKSASNIVRQHLRPWWCCIKNIEYSWKSLALVVWWKPMLCHKAGNCSTLRPISIEYVSAAFRLRHANRADRFHFSLCVNFHQVWCAGELLLPSSGSPEPSRADMQDFHFWQMPEHDAVV